MSTQTVTAELTPGFSGEGAVATPWPVAEAILSAPHLFRIATVRPDGRPHVVPLIAVWDDGALHFCTGAQERKAHNLAANPRCVLTALDGDITAGTEVVVEGRAEPVTDQAALARLAGLWRSVHGWEFEPRDSAFHHADGGRADVYRVRPVVAFAFVTGDMPSQTRYRFPV